MPKVAKELSVLAVKRITAPGTHAVGGATGLLLQVTATGARSWVLRASVGGRRREIGLGSYRDVSLADARDAARALRRQIAAGADPLEDRRETRAAALGAMAVLTFKEAARRLIQAKAPEWRNPKHAYQWTATLETYAFPRIGGLRVDRIGTSHVLEVLEPIWTTKTETAKRLRGRIEAVLDWAAVAGHRSGENPARWRGHLEHSLPNPGKVQKVKHHPALPYVEMPRFMEALRARGGAGKALELQILTAVRPNEVRGATWSEFDLAAGLWTIPAERMKMGREHVVPLPPPAVALLEALPQIAGVELLFPAARGGPLSDATLAKVVRLMHDADVKAGGRGYLDPRQERVAVAHGFRSTFRDWAAEISHHPRDVAEMALAHHVGSKTEAAYRRGELLAKRAKMMADWAEFIQTRPGSGNVTLIRQRAGNAPAGV